MYLFDHQQRKVTFREFNEDVNKLSKSLLNDLRLQRGDAIAIWSANCYEWLVAQHAAFRSGLIACALSPLYKSIELDFALKKAKVKALFMPGIESKQSFMNDFHAVLEKVDLVNIKKHLQHLIFIDGNEAKSAPQAMNIHTFNRLIANDGQLDESQLDVSPDDPAALFYTSGTTGKPKAALLSHYQMHNNIRFATEKTLQTKGPIVCPLPFFHAIAGICASLTPLISQKSIVFSNYWFDMQSAIKSLIQNECTEFWGVPAIVNGLCEFALATNTKFNSLKVIGMGGSAIHESLIRKIKQAIPSVEEIRIGYGSTEFGIFLTFTTKEDPEEVTMNTVGQISDHVAMKLVDPETKKIVKLGEQGEIWAKGYCRMLCYYDDEEKTREVIDQSGWYNMGDLGILDKNGYLKIVGRTKEMIIRGGINLFPKEIENILNTHPSVAEAHVCGVPSEEFGEEVCAWIKLKNASEKDAIQSEDIKKFCKDQLSYYKCPKYILFVDSFPMTGSGKVQKFLMTEKSCELLGLKK
ncbi:acyl-CoA synthetase-like protein [Dinothrombium tinctorium]|uniref:Medium-chain acyl-CoA ligase ACSF2, mitochondrial n=1 Tax=Dinothrombium tinctorium TaxID=1965070 RepID=A0A3S3P4C5_9ACAR|nr:acyl-CoA synthetase-like protein [Dinothrombium tinctorium]RWS04822.1 acyl-CoA synthetase-like protein [Dinothrombium tinctorium]RWS04845.1 acyl-CoA synthetase-like protein [Dinothrombium tinctorium]